MNNYKEEYFEDENDLEEEHFGDFVDFWDDTPEFDEGCSNLVERYVRNEGGYVDDFKECDVIEDIFDRVCFDCVHRTGCEIPNTRYREIATCPHVVERYLR